MKEDAVLDALSGIWTKTMAAARQSRKRFYDDGLEIARYAYTPGEKFEYQTLPSNAFFKAKVALTAEAMRVFGPYLYQVNPHRTATPRRTATQQHARIAEIVGDYLNYTPDKTDLYGQSRISMDDALSWGRGVMWTTVNAQGLVCSEQDSVRNLLLDPEARRKQDIRLVGRRHIMSRAEARKKYPKAAWKRIPKGSSKIDCLPWEQRPQSGADMVVFWCFYTNHGTVGLEGDDEYRKALLATDPKATTDTPMVFITSEEGKCIGTSPWEVPFYLEGEWPCSCLDFYDMPESVWPVSPLQPAIGYQRAINWLVTLMMGKYRFTSRTVGAIMKQAGEGLSDENIDKMLIGSDIEMMQITVKGEVKTLNQFVSEFNWSHDYLTAGMSLFAMLEARHQKASGLYEILYSGEGATQSRSARDADLKDRNSQSRVNDMRDRVAKWQSAAARKEALAVRFLKDGDHIGQILGEDAARDWGFLVKPGQNTVENWTQTLAEQGVPLQEAMAKAQELAAKAVDLTRWALETEYGIESDSIKRRDINQRIDSLKELMNQVVPLQIQSPDPMAQSIGYTTIASYHDAIGTDRDTVQLYREYAALLQQRAMAPPPMPPQPVPQEQPATPVA